MDSRIRKGPRPRMRGLTLGAVAVVAASMLGTAGAVTAQSPAADASAPAVEPVGSLRLGAFKGIDATPVFVALEQGIFEKNGLDLQETYVATGLEAINGIIAGEIDLSSAAVLPLLSSVQSGLPMVTMGIMHGNAVSDAYGGESLIASPESGIGVGEFEKLRGKRIGVPFGSNPYAFVLGLLDEAGIAQNEVELINIGPADVLAALKGGSIDAFALFEPTPTLALAQIPGAVRVSRAVTDTTEFTPGVMITSRDVVAQKGPAVQAYINSIAEAQQWIRANPEAAAETATRWIPNLEKDIALEAFKSIIFDSRFSKIVLDALEAKTMPRLVELGEIDAPIPLDQWVVTDFSRVVQQEHPEFFDDLPAIPEGMGL